MSKPSSSSDKPLHIGKPSWLKRDIPGGKTFAKIRKDLRSRSLYTVCEEAKCPNIGTCWNQDTATFMILGDTCTRACRFCHVKTGNPAGWLDPEEPRMVAESTLSMQLKYVVITMVDRDDLPDGGAAHISAVVAEVRRLNPGIRVEVLAGDFQNNPESLDLFLRAHKAPDVFAHNIETVERLSPRVRDGRADYQQSLAVLQQAKELSKDSILTKSAIMLGLGETLEEVEWSLEDLRKHQVDIVTLGQYLRPTKKHLSIKRYAPPEEFEKLRVSALKMGFRAVASGPLVRSSYRAHEYYGQAIKTLESSEVQAPNV